MTARELIWTSVVLLALCACGKGGDGSSPPAAPGAGAATAAAAAPERVVDICSLAPDADAAAALGAKVRNPARSVHSMGAECDYDFDFGDGHSGFFYVWAGKPALHFSRQLAGGETEDVAGLGQGAWIEHAMPEDSWDLHVQVAPDLAFEAKGDRKERVLALGTFLATRLQ